MTTRQYDPGFPPPLRTDYRDERPRFVQPSRGPSRYVMQSHALSAPIASPRALIVAALIAVVLYIVGRRLSD